MLNDPIRLLFQCGCIHEVLVSGSIQMEITMKALMLLIYAFSPGNGPTWPVLGLTINIDTANYGSCLPLTLVLARPRVADDVDAGSV
jgi:hypothetical protein